MIDWIKEHKLIAGILLIFLGIILTTIALNIQKAEDLKLINAEIEKLEFHQNHNLQSATEYRMIEDLRHPPIDISILKYIALCFVALGFLIHGFTLINIQKEVTVIRGKK